MNSIKYNKDGREYIISKEENCIAVELNGEKRIVPCKVNKEYALKVNRESFSSVRGAESIFEDYKYYIEEDFARCWVDHFVDMFFPEFAEEEVVTRLTLFK